MVDGTSPGSQVIIVPGGYGRAVRVMAGQYVSVRDVHGGQCGDFWALDAGDLDHYFSPMHTWVHVGRIQLRVGDELVSNRREPLLTLMRDDVGQHDMFFPACDRQRYARYYGIHEHRNCCDNFREAIEAFHWRGPHTPQPLNLFMRTSLSSNGELTILDPISRAGDTVTFRALQDLIIVLSACPMDLNPVGGSSITDLEIAVSEAQPQ